MLIAKRALIKPFRAAIINFHGRLEWELLNPLSAFCRHFATFELLVPLYHHQHHARQFSQPGKWKSIQLGLAYNLEENITTFECMHHKELSLLAFTGLVGTNADNEKEEEDINETSSWK